MAVPAAHILHGFARDCPLPGRVSGGGPGTLWSVSCRVAESGVLICCPRLIHTESVPFFPGRCRCLISWSGAYLTPQPSPDLSGGLCVLIDVAYTIPGCVLFWVGGTMQPLILIAAHQFHGSSFRPTALIPSSFHLFSMVCPDAIVHGAAHSVQAAAQALRLVVFLGAGQYRQSYLQVGMNLALTPATCVSFTFRVTGTPPVRAGQGCHTW